MYFTVFFIFNIYANIYIYIYNMIYLYTLSYPFHNFLKKYSFSLLNVLFSHFRFRFHIPIFDFMQSSSLFVR